MLKELNILKHHGIQYVPDLKKVSLTPLFRGRPELSDNISNDIKEALINLCPVNAFVNEPFGLDMGKCLFCNECHLAFPSSVSFTNDYKIASNERKNLIIYQDIKTPVSFDENRIKPEIRKILRNSLKLRQVSAAGDNSCEMELNAAGNVNFDMGRFGIEFVASPRHADGIVITGPISVNMADALQLTYDAVPTPKIIILCGTEAISGGIFQFSNAINRYFPDNYFIDLYIPGNPAHPLSFINGLLELLGK